MTLEQSARVALSFLTASKNVLLCFMWNLPLEQSVRVTLSFLAMSKRVFQCFMWNQSIDMKSAIVSSTWNWDLQTVICRENNTKGYAHVFGLDCRSQIKTLSIESKLVEPKSVKPESPFG